MTIAEIAEEACINCGKVKAESRTIEPWGNLCSHCDDAMSDLYVVKVPVPDHTPPRGVCLNTLR